MELNSIQRNQVAQVMGQYLENLAPANQSAGWVTLWSQPSRLEPDVVKLIAVLDQGSAVKSVRRVREEIQSKMILLVSGQGLRLFLDVVPTSEFHRMYQSQNGFELIQEWNGERQENRKPSILGAWLKSNKAFRVLAPVLIACTLIWIIKTYLAQAI